MPPPLETLLYAWQHTLVDVSPYVLPMVVAAAVGYTPAQAAAMISACLMLMGVATFANATWGNRLPSVLGPSATDTGAMATAGALFGAPAMWMAGFVGGLIEIAVGASGVLARLRRFLPPYVCGIIVLTIGVTLARVAGGHSGDWSAKLTNGSTAAATCAINDSPDWVGKTSAGTYTGAVWVRGDTSGAIVKLRLREYAGSTAVGSAVTQSTLTTSWQKLSVPYTIGSPGSTLDFNAYISSAAPGSCFYADDASLDLK